MERRSLTAAVSAIPSADPQAVHDFIVQESRTTPADASRQRLSQPPAPFAQPSATVPSARQRRSKSAGVTPVGLIPVTVRLRPELAGALKRASLERQLQGDELFTQQELVERALEPWLRSEGYLD